jgi:hypothetical protein
MLLESWEKPVTDHSVSRFSFRVSGSSWNHRTRNQKRETRNYLSPVFLKAAGRYAGAFPEEAAERSEAFKADRAANFGDGNAYRQ